MHFFIPDTQELYAESTTTYTGYNIYINGSYHCCLRYKQLRALHEQLRRRSLELDLQLPVFPPKRLLPLNGHQLEARRAALEHYLQLIGQDMRVAKLELFQNFFLKAQLETALAEGTGIIGNMDVDSEIDEIPMKITTLEVVLANGYKLHVNCHIGDSSSTLLKNVCNYLNLSTQLVPYFCLFLVRKEHNSNAVVLLRRLMDFESPFLSSFLAKPCQIILRKSYWNPLFDVNLLQDSVALNLLFIQTVSDVEHNWVVVPPEMNQKLKTLKQHSFKKEYLDLVRQLPLYGCLQFNGIVIDDFSDSTSINAPTLISIGNKELSMRRAGQSGKMYETKFRVTRMRCWRVTTLHDTSSLEIKNDAPSKSSFIHTNLQLSFEYLMSKQTLRWVTIVSSQAMLMSVCLQSMVDELLNYKDATQLNNRTDNYSNASYVYDSESHSLTSSYVARSGRSGVKKSQLATSSSTPSLLFSSEQHLSTSPSESTASTASTPAAPVKFLSETRNTKTQSHPRLSYSKFYSAVFFRNESTQDDVRNEAFEGIGDEDL